MKNFKKFLLLALFSQLVAINPGNAATRRQFTTASQPSTGTLITRTCLPFLIAPAQDATETYHHQAGGIQFSAPKSWKATPDGDVLTISTPDDSLAIVFWVAEEEGFEEAANALDKELSKTIKKLKSKGKPEEGTLNGMPAYLDGGTGEVGGTTIQWSVFLIKAKKPVIILSFAAPGVWDKYSDDYERVVKSVKKT